MIKELSTYFNTELIPLSEKLKLIQVDNGAIELKQHVYATQLLEIIKDKLKFICERLNTIDLYHAQCTDIDNWLKKGLDTPPYFDVTKRTYKPMLNRDVSFFWGPTIMANAGTKRGHFFEGFLVLRDEPEECEALYTRFPHPKNICQSCHLLVGTSGFSEGNCLVFFPENIKSNHKDEIQTYAVFFFNKFHSIYNQITVPSVKSLVASPQLHSSQLNKRDAYVARCIWGYLHDYFHHCGAKPFDENVYLKTRWAVGVLEEIKVDMQTLKVCLEQKIPFSKEISEFILYERLVRYPQEADYSNNFDSATGFTLLSWFERYSAVKVLTNTIEIDWKQLLKVIPIIVNTIEDIESAPTDEMVIAKANSFLFGNYLERPKGRFSPAKNINVAPLTQYFGKSDECMNMLDLTSYREGVELTSNV